MNTIVKQDLQTGITKEQINNFVSENKGYEFVRTFQYPCENGTGMRASILLKKIGTTEYFHENCELGSCFANNLSEAYQIFSEREKELQ